MTKSIVWFRYDLRINDNPALNEAVKNGDVLAVYIYDKNENIGGASKYWLHNALNDLNKSLSGNLNIYNGEPLTILKDLVKKFNIDNVFWNRFYCPYTIKRDKEIKETLTANVKSFSASLLYEPWEITKDDGSYYKVFTPFYKKCITHFLRPRPPLTYKAGKYTKDSDCLAVDDLNLMPKIKWYVGIGGYWEVSESQAHKKLDSFINNGLENYELGRDYPALESVSELSPYLHFGQISPNQIFEKIDKLPQNNQTEHFIRELIWREFSYYQLYYQPHITQRNLRPQFDKFDWVENPEFLKAWQTGQTGIPIVDAGMRQLWKTGYMHNRVRMIVGSFLVKNLRIHWKHGEAWFWDCLVDADIASNNASWQWVAGTGVDAAPYFRIFNPITQSKRFDGDGEYIRKYVPEIAELPNKYLFEPHTTPTDILEHLNIKIGETYPAPIVDVKQSAKQAMACFKNLK